MTLHRIGIVGSGTMGSGIALEAALNGHDVVVRTRSEEAAIAVAEACERFLTRRVDRGTLSIEERSQTLDRLRVTTELSDLYDRHLVIESVVEDLEVKSRLFGELDRLVPPESILATNTSTLPVIALAGATHRPDRVVGIHFFNPVTHLRLVEIVRTLVVDEEVIRAAKGFVEGLGKEPIVVADEAGFVVNALLFPYLNSAVKLLERRVASKEDIDRSMQLGCNFPIGPFALLDLVGLDVAIAILDRLYRESGDPAVLVAPLLSRMVYAGWLGRKTGRGFYDYE
ncbi:MAG: 3-hydroxyacyl-CoA dehydrogenase family protein [Ferrimicrobium sp.]